MLAIINYIRANGLDKAIESFKLKSRIYENKIILKYDQLESNMALPEVQECRGLILEKDTWEILSYPMRKFFNLGEGNAADIDLSTAKCLIKYDGSLIHAYWDWNKDMWFAATTGMAEGEGEVNNLTNSTFNELFWRTANLNLTKLDKDLVYMFELCTPENVVVTPHTEYKVVLLAIRNRVTLKEFQYSALAEVAETICVPMAEFIDMKINSLNEIKDRFANMPFHEEGYVVIDNKFNRVKLKNPAYVAVHMLKGKTGFHHIMDIIKSNEVDEYITTFPTREVEIRELKVSYTSLINTLYTIWTELSKFNPSNGLNTQKEYAAEVFKITDEYNLRMFSGLFFQLAKSKTSSIMEYIKDVDNKILYELLK